MRLKTLLSEFSDTEIDLEIAGISLDSRKTKKGDVFIALSGSQHHGLIFAQTAITQGAIVIVYESDDFSEKFFQKNNITIPAIAIKNLSECYGKIAARFFNYPSKNLNVIGITGTNGKTSCSQFLSQMLDDCAVIGTLGWGDLKNLTPTENTTPDALTIQTIFSKLLKQQKRAVAMEVSSHGLSQNRLEGTEFKGAVFTNISRDHLDYHHTMANYLNVKLKLLHFSGLEFVVVNLDDEYSVSILSAIPCSIKIWGVTKNQTNALIEKCHFFIIANNLIHEKQGISVTFKHHDLQKRVTLPLFGDFNVDNVLCVLAVLLALKISFEKAVEKLANLKPVLGRMEWLYRENFPSIFIDYAHTPDALKKVLQSVKQHCLGDLWVVFGCGGNRDSGKRAEMGQIATQFADKIIVTDDNPRFESSETIIEQILSGANLDKITVIYDRKEAIISAIKQANLQDCIVIAGKGHETYQEINGIKLPFSDCAIVKESLGI